MATSIRNRGATKLLIGSLGMAAVWLLVHFARSKGFVPSSLVAMIPLAIPGVYALIGLLEIIAGVPFVEIAEKWDSLAGWQRGVLGLFIVVCAFAAAIVAMVLFAQP